MKSADLHKEYADASFSNPPMQLSSDQQNTLKVILSRTQTKEELLALLNALKKTESGEKFEPIRLNTLTFFGDHRLSSATRYRHFTIKKKSGGARTISSPAEPLKEIQRYISVILAAVYEPDECVTGFTAQRSIVNNATAHVGKQFVFNIDLKDFFPSIELHRVKAVLKLAPFNLANERESLAFLIARLSTVSVEGKGVLPQGAPTSPVLSNIICQKLDHRLSGLAKRFGAAYTRYADDITFSAETNIFRSVFKKEMRRIIEDQHFTINQAKVRLQGKGYRQEVTGLTVNEKVNVSKRYTREIRAMLHNWQKLGYAQAEAIFSQHYQADKGHVKNDKPILRNVLNGKLNYLKMVRGEADSVFLRYKSQFEILEGRPPVEAPLPLPVSPEKNESGRLADQSAPEILVKLAKLLSLWESEGIEAALNDGKA